MHPANILVIITHSKINPNNNCEIFLLYTFFSLFIFYEINKVIACYDHIGVIKSFLTCRFKQICEDLDQTAPLGEV